MSDSTSMDFLGQKRRVRPVRKVQVSTHFDELSITHGFSSTPDPPAIEADLLKHVSETSEDKNSVLEAKKMPAPEPKPAVYAPKPPTPPPELNTLVPEDFNFIDFNFNSLKKKKEAEENVFMHKVIKTDDTFQKLDTENPAETVKQVTEEPQIAKEAVAEPKSEHSSEAKDSNIDSKPAVIAGATVATAVAAIALQSTDKTSEKAIVEEPLKKVSEARKSIEPAHVVPKVDDVVKEAPKEVVEVLVPPPLPTNTAHLIAARESLKPSLLPVKPVNGAPSTEPAKVNEELLEEKLKLEAESKKSAEELEKLKKEIEIQRSALEKEIEMKKGLETRLEDCMQKSGALEDAVKSKEEIIRQLQDDHKRTNIELLEVREDKKSLESLLEKAEKELTNINESNAKAYIEKSDEVNGLKDEILGLTSQIAEKNASIKALEENMKAEVEAREAMLKKELEESAEYDKMEDELIKIVEEEIMRMQDTLDEQREYNTKLQTEVDSEYAYWKKRLSENQAGK